MQRPGDGTGQPCSIVCRNRRILRTPYSLESGGEGSGVWKSVDGGETWKGIFPPIKDCPKAPGYCGVTVCPSNTDKVYALLENKDGGLYMSNDGGENWTLQTVITISASVPGIILPGIRRSEKREHRVRTQCKLLKSTDGGKSFRNINTPHGDHHDLWIGPPMATALIIADDGGAQVSFDGGNNWSTYMNQPRRSSTG